MNDCENLIEAFESLCPDPEHGLPEDVFLLLSRLAPLVNVDLLIQDAQLGTLLTWRHDRIFGTGWHVPGGIIRYRERTADRIRAVARREIGIDVDFDPAPILVDQRIDKYRRDRAHHISLLYRCRPVEMPDEERRCDLAAPVSGCWMWHRTCPALIAEQQAYAALIGSAKA